MRLLLRTIMVGSALLGVMPANRLAAQANPFLGTWKLDVAKSKSTPGPAAKSVTVKMEPAGAAFKITVSGVAADDKPISMSYTMAYDGKDYPVTGSAEYDAVSAKMLNPLTRHTVRKKGGKEVQTVHSVLSADGKHYTATTTGVNAKGEKIQSTAVYDKQ